MDSLSGDEIRELRTHLELPQAKMAKWLGVDQRSVRRWENNECPMRHAGMLILALEAIATENLREAPPYRPPMTRIQLRERREALGLSQFQLASMLGLHVISYRRIELGMRSNRFARMMDFAVERLEYPKRLFKDFEVIRPPVVAFDPDTDYDGSATDSSVAV